MIASPLHEVVVLDYSQYVAGPFCTMLLADLGAEVIKIEPPQGDQWRRQEPCADDLSLPFVALNRNKRSVILDLKSETDRVVSGELIHEADIVVHNVPVERARAFGLDAGSVLAANPSATLIRISAFGTDGPAAHLTGYDLNAQAASGLLMADARIGDEVPIRAGGIAMTDFTAGLLAALAGLAGLTRARATGKGGETEVSLLGAGLALQAQRFISTARGEPASRGGGRAGKAELDATAEAMAEGLRTNGYYRAYRTADGFIAVGCLNLAQRKSLLGRFGLQDASVENPDEPPENKHEARQREEVFLALAARLADGYSSDWVAELRSLGIPCDEVRTLDDVFWDRQVIANGLIQEIDQPGLGALSLLGNLFKVDGQALPARRPAPMPGQDTVQILQTLGAKHPAPIAAERST